MRKSFDFFFGLRVRAKVHFEFFQKDKMTHPLNLKQWENMGLFRCLRSN